MSSSSPPLMFSVRRCQPELVTPAIPTPHEIKLLSDIDDQQGFRFQIPLIHIYPHKPSMGIKDPVEVMREALAKTLVFYYPVAGRLREGPNRKLMVDCTGEGVLFIEADADVKLDQFDENHLQPPFPCFQELLCDVPGTGGIINCPLLLIQVTRLKCGGLIVAGRINHTMWDAAGYVQFMNSWAEMAKGASQPSILPVWCRELLLARDPPSITCNHREYEEATMISYDDDDMVQRSFFFGPTEIATLLRLVPRHLGVCTKFEVITACIWYCRTKALQLEPEKEVRMMCIVNARGRLLNPPLPIGYDGNAFTFPAAITTSRKLCGSPFGYAVELIKKAKDEATEEYIHSVADFMATKGRPLFTTVRSCIVSNISRAGLRDIDFGWGKAVYGGVADARTGDYLGATFLMSYENAKGENGILFPIYLPEKAMRRFEKELSNMLGNQNQLTRSGQYLPTSSIVQSAL